VTVVKIAVIDHQTQVPPSVAQDWVAAVRLQIFRDFQPSWGIGARVLYVPGAQVPPAGYWQLVLLDDADQAGALGYHDLTAAGLPLGKVFVKTTLVYGGQPSVTLSHEALEMLADPYVSLVVVDKTDVVKFWANEVCDAVEDDSLGYDITLPATTTQPVRLVRVSDFVLPQYFDTAGSPADPFSFKGHLTATVPALAAGGYMAYVLNGVWSQINLFKEPPGPAQERERFVKRIGGPLDPRRLKRLIPHDQWVRSTIP